MQGEKVWPRGFGLFSGQQGATEGPVIRTVLHQVKLSLLKRMKWEGSIG